MGLFFDANTLLTSAHTPKGVIQTVPQFLDSLFPTRTGLTFRTAIRTLNTYI